MMTCAANAIQLMLSLRAAVSRVVAVTVLISLVASAGHGEGQRTWTTTNGQSFKGDYAGLNNGQVAIAITDASTAIHPFASLSVVDRKHVVATEHARPPREVPTWIKGYRARYTIRVVSDFVNNLAETVIAQIPSGGWVRPDASDVVIQSASGATIPFVVLSHDPKGDTIIQFRKKGVDRWYWVSISNPNAPPQDFALEKRLASSKSSYEQALLAKMSAMKQSALKAAELRDLIAAIALEEDTSRDAAAELVSWDKLLPELIATAEAAVQKIPPAQVLADQAAKAHAPFAAVVAETRHAAETATRASKSARAAASAGEKAHQVALTAVGEAQMALDAAVAEGKADAKTKLIAAQQAAEAAVAREAAADRDAAAKKPAAQAARAAAKAARLAAAPTAAAKKEAEASLAKLQAASNAAAAAVTQLRQAVQRAKTIKATADAELLALKPKLEPAKAAAASTAAATKQAIDGSRQKGVAYFDLALDADPRLFKEGMTVEYREWAGDDLGRWADVVKGLQVSETVTDNAIVWEVLQNEKLFRRTTKRNFAASYRGYLRVTQPGVYSFCANGDDATFLFMNGYKVYSRTGSNKPLRGNVAAYSIGADIQLEAGVHPFEMHQVVGNTPGATGYCKLLWLTPGATSWSVVPKAAYTSSLLAVPVKLEAPDGGQIAAFEFGMDDELRSDGMVLYLGRFEAQGVVPNPDKLVWSFPDKDQAHGASVAHAFFAPGDIEVALKSHPSLPAFVRRCHIRTPPIPTGARSLRTAVDVLGAASLSNLDTATLNEIFHFLVICRQPSRWPVLAKLCTHLLSRKGLDLRYRAMLHTALIEASAHIGGGAEVSRLLQEALADVGHVRTLRAWVLFQTANVQRDQLRDFDAAGKLYAQQLDEGRRLRHPLVRHAAVGWGDMFLDMGDFARAGATYRLARQLGRVGVAIDTADPTKRGALLRVAEQQLKSGDIRQSKRVLHQIESEFPEQKLDGLYRYLRGETDRHGGEYEDAIRHYEALMQLSSWTSYRPHAAFGVADSYYRLGDFDKATHWLNIVKESYPQFYAQQKLDAVATMIVARQKHADGRAEAPPVAHDVTGMDDDEVSVNFESDGTAEDTKTWHGRRSMGFAGPDSCVAVRIALNTRVLDQPIVNIPPSGTLWVEFWYRDWGGIGGTGAHRLMSLNLMDAAGTRVGHATLYPERTFGRWRKAAYHFRVPTTTEGRLEVYIQDSGEQFEIDDLRILTISDKEHNALTGFIDGADPQ